MLIFKRFKIKENINKKIIILLYVFCLVAYNQDTLLYINVSSIPYFIVTIIISIHFFYNVFLKRVYFDIKILVSSIILISLVFITILFNSDFRGGYIQVILNIALAFMFVSIVKVNDFIVFYNKIMYFLCAYSLVFVYLIGNIMRNIGFNPLRYENSEGIAFINGIFASKVDIENYIRNFGVFREPGVYIIFIILAIIFEMFYFKNKETKSNKRLIVYILALLTTLSTPGYLTLVFLVIIYILKNLTKSISHKKIIMYYGFFNVCIIFLAVNNFTRDIIIETINRFSNEHSSFSIRYLSIKSNIQVWLESPIWGNGITDGVSEKFAMYFGNDFEVHNTTTIGAYLAVFGLFFVVVLLIGFLKFYVNLTNNRYLGICIFVIFMLPLNSQMIIYNLIIFVIFFYGISKSYSSINSTDDNNRIINQ